MKEQRRCVAFIWLPCKYDGWHPIWQRRRTKTKFGSCKCYCETRAFDALCLIDRDVLITHFISFQSSDPLETRVWQLHDWGNSRAAVRWDHVRVQHCGRQHGEAKTRGLLRPESEWNPLHHHLISKVFWFKSIQLMNVQFDSLWC